jgi:hypothetical protein
MLEELIVWADINGTIAGCIYSFNDSYSKWNVSLGHIRLNKSSSIAAAYH